MKTILLTILGIVIFFGGAYLMGNYLLDTFNDNIPDQIMGTLLGIMAWLLVAVVGLFIAAIYNLAKERI